MKINYILLIITVLTTAFSCKQKPENNKNENTPKNNTVKIDSADYIASQSAVKVADSIMYIANVKNPDPNEAYYMDQWLSGVNTRKLADIIFDAVYNKRLKAYNYITGEEMRIEDVKELEKEFSRKDIGQILFTEDWYFDEQNLKMYKQVNSVMLAYFRYDDDGNLLGNKSGIRVYLNGTKPMRGAQDY